VEIAAGFHLLELYDPRLAHGRSPNLLGAESILFN
jgi:hypothetical protein